ncbi:MAG: polysaccharide deacetylase family protein [Actinomycetota bacterium]|nr:polysaccharide deacetylase family protein [Actinomycetota bacterium]
MREQQMVRAGNVLRRVGAAAVATSLHPSDNLRVSLTHHVAAGAHDNFARLIDQMCSERAPVDAGDVVRSYAGQGVAAIEGRRVAFTFDDGLLSSFAAAQSLLNPRGIKAIFFIPTMILGLTSPEQMRDFFRQNVYRRASGELPPDRYMTMSADHLQELHAQGHTVLPHTHSHVSLVSLRTPEELDRELRMPKLLLEDMLQSPSDGFAFPFGTDRVVHRIAYQAVRRLYPVCFTGLGGINKATTDRHCLHRDCVHPHHLPQHVANVTSGVFDLYYQHRMRRLKRRIGRRLE